MKAKFILLVWVIFILGSMYLPIDIILDLSLIMFLPVWIYKLYLDLKKDD